MGIQAGKMDNVRATPLEKNVEIVSSLKGKGEVLLHFRALGTPKPSTKFDLEFEKNSTPGQRQMKRRQNGTIAVSINAERNGQRCRKGVRNEFQEQKGSRGRPDNQ